MPPDRVFWPGNNAASFTIAQPLRTSPLSLNTPHFEIVPISTHPKTPYNPLPFAHNTAQSALTKNTYCKAKARRDTPGNALISPTRLQTLRLIVHACPHV